MHRSVRTGNIVYNFNSSFLLLLANDSQVFPHIKQEIIYKRIYFICMCICINQSESFVGVGVYPKIRNAWIESHTVIFKQPFPWLRYIIVCNWSHNPTVFLIHCENCLFHNKQEVLLIFTCLSNTFDGQKH